LELVKGKTELKVYGWCLMTNHVYFLIGEGKEEGSDRSYDENFENRYTQSINWNSIINGVSNLTIASGAYGTAALVLSIISAPAGDAFPR
jgi:hypothetical protein